MNFASINNCDTANGPGVRVSLFVSGCTNGCKGCFNKQAFDFNFGKLFMYKDLVDIMNHSEPGYVSGLTVLGGEPLHPRNVGEVLNIVKHYRMRFGHNKTIWVYTGYKYEHLTTPLSEYGEEKFLEEGYKDYPYCQEALDLLKEIDVLVDGRFEEDKRDLTLKFRGSSNQRIIELTDNKIKEFHLFAGIGGGIYGGMLLNHKCCGGVEIMPYAQTVLTARQNDGWMEKFPLYPDICKLDGNLFKGKFDVLCGGFPCQAFSTAAHGKNIAAKNLWGEMFRFVKESDAPVVFGENVVLRAINKAKEDLESIGYTVARIKLGCSDLGADHQRNRFWLLAVKDWDVFDKIYREDRYLPRLTGHYWEKAPSVIGNPVPVSKKDRRDQLLGVGNAQSPFVAAAAFRILEHRLYTQQWDMKADVSDDELDVVFEKRETWMQRTFDHIGLVHTPTTMANYACASMMKHQGCRNFVTVFGRPEPENAEYLMGFPLGASSPNPIQSKENLERFLDN